MHLLSCEYSALGCFLQQQKMDEDTVNRSMSVLLYIYCFIGPYFSIKYPLEKYEGWICWIRGRESLCTREVGMFLRAPKWSLEWSPANWKNRIVVQPGQRLWAESEESCTVVTFCAVPVQQDLFTALHLSFAWYWIYFFLKSIKDWKQAENFHV